MYRSARINIGGSKRDSVLAFSNGTVNGGEVDVKFVVGVNGLRPFL